MIFPVNQKGKDAASRVGLGRLLSLCSLCLSLLVSLLLPTVTCLFRRPGAKSVYQNFAWPLRIGSYRRIPGRFQLSYKFLSSSVKKNISSNRSVTARVFAAEEQIHYFVHLVRPYFRTLRIVHIYFYFLVSFQELCLKSDLYFFAQGAA